MLTAHIKLTYSSRNEKNNAAPGIADRQSVSLHEDSHVAGKAVAVLNNHQRADITFTGEY